MSAVVWATSAVASTASVTTQTVTLPAGWAAGDVFFIFVELTATTGTITAPAGYSTAVPSFHGSTSTSSSHAVFYKVLTSSESDPAYTCTSGRAAAVGVLVRGADQATPLDGVTATTDANATEVFGNIVVPAITPATSGALLLRGYAVRNANNGATSTFNTSGGSMSAFDNQAASAVAASSNAGVAVAHQDLTDTSAQASVTGTWTSGSGVTTGGAMGSSIVVRAGAGAAAFIPRRMPLGA